MRPTWDWQLVDGRVLKFSLTDEDGNTATVDLALADVENVADAADAWAKLMRVNARQRRGGTAPTFSLFDSGRAS